MYVAAGVIAGLFLLLGILSRKESTEESVSKLLRPLYRMAIYLYKRICVRKIPIVSDSRVEKNLEKLHPGVQKQQMCTEYYVNKLVKSLVICLAGAFLGLICSVQARTASLLDCQGAIARGTYEEGAREVEVVCRLPEGKQEFRLSVAARIFEEQEIREIQGAFLGELSELMKGENPSLREVSKKLALQECYEGYPFLVSWTSGNTDVVRGDGTVSFVETPQEINLLARISYEEWEWEESISVTVIPPELSEAERTHIALEKLLLASERDSRTKGEWKLPDSWQEQELLWEQKTEDMGPWLLAVAVAVAFAVYLLADKDLQDEVEKRKKRMQKEYPDVVHKLTLYLGAGMTIRGAFQRMGEEYESTARGEREENPVYEEILHACRELRMGSSEGAVYERFGKRTGLQEYIRLCTLLTQNLKKGNSTLLQRLREEADKASLERLQYGKRLGEEAVTKLLLPMVMMLLVVMLMIMIPAFSSMGV